MALNGRRGQIIYIKMYSKNFIEPIKRAIFINIYNINIILNMLVTYHSPAYKFMRPSAE